MASRPGSQGASDRGPEAARQDDLLLRRGWLICCCPGPGRSWHAVSTRQGPWFTLCSGTVMARPADVSNTFRSQAVLVGFSCGQVSWSGARAESDNAIKRKLTSRLLHLSGSGSRPTGLSDIVASPRSLISSALLSAGSIESHV
jgi:hypothetical protein